MRIETKYVCEQTGLKFNSKTAAKICEEQKLSPCPVKVGDKVKVKTRYDGLCEDEVVAIEIVGSVFGEMATEYEDGTEALRKLVLSNNSSLMKEYVILVKNLQQIGKDYYTDRLSFCNIQFEGEPNAD